MLRDILLPLMVMHSAIIFGSHQVLKEDSTLVLQEVQVTHPKKEFLVGTSMETLSLEKLNTVSGGTVADAITRYLPNYIKHDGGGLATLRIRGTSPNHNTVQFEGININSLTLGQSNFVNIPTFLFDQINVQYGGASALYGSGAIGGSIQLSNQTKWDKGINIKAQQDIGSFGLYFTGLRIGVGTKNLIYTGKFYQYKKENNFPFLNTAVKDFTTGQFVKDTMKHASIRNLGTLQNLTYRFSQNLTSSVKLWYEDNFHNIMRTMSTNYYGGNKEDIQDKNLRLILSTKYKEGKHNLSINIGYVKDYQLYNHNVSQTVSTQSLIASINYFNYRVVGGSIQVGYHYRYITPKAYAYQSSLDEHRLDIYGAYKKVIRQRLSLSLNLREAIVFRYKESFAPSLGVDYLLFKRPKQFLKLQTLLSYSYKIPTFNDRFWVPGGNPSLIPETAINYELGGTYVREISHHKINLSIRLYNMVVDNWIQWVKNGYWHAVNLKKVKSQGIESSLSYTLDINQWEISPVIKYNLTHTINLESYNEQSKLIGKQLAYTPRHAATSYIIANYKRWSVNASYSYIGERVSESNETLASYELLALSLSNKISLTKHALLLQVHVNNLLDKHYQNQAQYAMPGRAYKLTIQYYFNQ